MHSIATSYSAISRVYKYVRILAVPVLMLLAMHAAGLADVGRVGLSVTLATVVADQPPSR